MEFIPSRHLKVHSITVLRPKITMLRVSIFALLPHDTEINQLDTALWCEEDIVWFDVTMGYLVGGGVEVREGGNNLIYNGLCDGNEVI